MLLAVLLLPLLPGAAETEPATPKFRRIFCWGYPADDAAAARYAQAGVTDIQVRTPEEAQLARKYGMTPYFSCFMAAGPHRQSMTPEEEEYTVYINGLDLAPGLPRAERMKIIHRRRIEKKHRYGGEMETKLDTLRCDIPCFISDEGLELSRHRVDELLKKAPPGVAGIYLDYIGYTNHRGCYCPKCLEKLRRHLAENHLADTPENRAGFYRDRLVEYYNAVIDYIKSRRPDFRIVVHLYPDFQPDPLFGNRVKADFCGQTVAWYFQWQPDKIERYTRHVVEHAKDHHPGSEGIPFIGVNTSRTGSLGFKTPETVERELRIILAAGGRTLMVCNGPAILEPGYFEIFKKYTAAR